MEGWQAEASIAWRNLTPFGVEVDADLSAPLSEGAAHLLTELFWQAGLVIAHGQTLTMERQTALLSLIGPILRRQGEDGYISTIEGVEASMSALPFHSDAAYTTAPFHALSLHAVDVQDGASSTQFVSAVRAYAALAEPLREVLASHTVEMIAPTVGTMSQRTCDIRDPEAMVRGERPGLFEHPHTGQTCVWVGEMNAARILGMDWEESGEVLRGIYAQLYAPDNLYEHVWRNGDFVMWDNIALQHARGPLHGVGKRILQRVIVGTEGCHAFCASWHLGAIARQITRGSAPG